MTISITIKPQSNTHTEDLKRWCRENVGPPGMDWYLSDPGWDFIDTSLIFTFAHSEDASLFKLANQI